MPATTTTRTKRPLLHPSPSPNLIFISTKTPFISALKRVETTLTKLSTPIADSAHRKPLSQRNGSRIAASAASSGSIPASKVKALAWEWPEDGKTVVVKGTGRAAGKVLELAGELRKRGECEVRVRTGTVGAVDDLTVVKKKRRVEAGGGGVEVDDEEEEEGEVEEKTVQRGVSVVELLVRKR